jgi:predicted nuclease of restriction endonuclease-like (RecB) superfamily
MRESDLSLQFSDTVPRMSNDITTRNRIPTQTTPEGEDLPPNYAEILNEVKTEVRRGYVRTQRAANTEMIAMYWRIGKIIADRQAAEGWGAKVVQYLAADLKTAYPGQSGFSERNLKYMLRLARTWPDGIVQQAAAQLPWGHTMLLLDKLNDTAMLEAYAAAAASNGWSRADLQRAIESKLLERKGLAAHNFPATIPDRGDQVEELLTEPYRLDFTGLTEKHSERELEDALVGNIVTFLQELGVGFAFVGRQYALRVGGEDFRPDLLFYHLNLRRFVVIELKTTPAEPSHVGQLGFYTAVIDDKVRVPERDEPTIGLLIAKSKNGEVIDYALHASGKPIAVSTYTALEPEMKAMLPEPRALSRIVDETIAEHVAEAD